MYNYNKIILFCHLHTLIDRKMEKVDRFRAKKFKLAFRVPNHSAVVLNNALHLDKSDKPLLPDL
jgi:hypothetical protein